MFVICILLYYFNPSFDIRNFIDMMFWVYVIIFMDSIITIVILVCNIYRRKNYNFIKNNGKKLTAFIITAWSENYRKSFITFGNLYVSANGIEYTISDIYYNDDFKVLEEDLRKNYLKKIKIDIYVLNNKVVADLDSISI